MFRKLIFSLPVLFSLSLILCSCGKSDNGPVEQQTRSLSNFDAVNLQIDAEVNISQGAVFNISISAESKILDAIETSVSGSTLLIQSKYNTTIKNSSPVKINITMPKVGGLILSGSGKIHVDHTITNSALSLLNEGSGNISLSGISVSQLAATLNGSGNINAGTGSTQGLSVNVKGSGSINLADIQAQTGNVNILGSGSARVFVTDNLTINITGSGNVYYKGSPVKSVTITGSGKVVPL